MKQDLSRRICVQLLQTLNILFENITNQTAICKYSFALFEFFFSDYLLSNNHTNAIITHRFDFTDEEVDPHSYLPTLFYFSLLGDGLLYFLSKNIILSSQRKYHQLFLHWGNAVLKTHLKTVHYHYYILVSSRV